MFRPLTGHHLVVTFKEKGYILYSPQPFSLNVQPDDGLLKAKTCSCLAVTIIQLYIYIIQYSCVFDILASAV
jgi:hypothetical protein